MTVTVTGAQDPAAEPEPEPEPLPVSELLVPVSALFSPVDVPLGTVAVEAFWMVTVL